MAVGQVITKPLSDEYVGLPKYFITTSELTETYGTLLAITSAVEMDIPTVGVTDGINLTSTKYRLSTTGTSKTYKKQGSGYHPYFKYNIEMPPGTVANFDIEYLSLYYSSTYTEIPQAVQKFSTTGVFHADTKNMYISEAIGLSGTGVNNTLIFTKITFTGYGV